MIEKTVLDYLNDSLSEPVFMERPENPVYPYVLVEITGAEETNHIRSAVIAVQSYAESMYEAALLNDRVLNAMSAIDELASVSKCSINSYYNFTNTTTKEYRYQAVFNLVYMED